MKIKELLKKFIQYEEVEKINDLFCTYQFAHYLETNIVNDFC